MQPPPSPAFLTVGYVVLSHGDPRGAGRLVRRLAPEAAGVVIHHDKGSGARSFAALREEVAGTGALLAPRRRCRWGGFSLVAATLDAVRMLLAEKSCDYVALVSGAHYPAVPAGRVARALDPARNEQYLDARPLPQPHYPGRGGLDRLETYYPLDGTWWLANRASGAMRQLQRLAGHRRSVLHGMAPYVGSQWWCLSAECLRWVLEHPHLEDHVRFFRHTWIPDESFFQTLIMNSPWRELVRPYELTYMRWAPGASGPVTLTIRDVPAVRAQAAPFVRKVDPDVSRELLDLLDAEEGAGGLGRLVRSGDET